MNAGRGLTPHYVIRSLILFGFAMLIVYLVKTDKILYYIAPRMIIYVKLSAVGLYVIGIYQVYQAFRAWRGKPAAGCDCEHEHALTGTWFKHSAIYAMFALPLIMAVALPDTTMGSALAAKKGVNLSSSSSVKSTVVSGGGASASGTNAPSQANAGGNSAAAPAPEAATPAPSSAPSTEKPASSGADEQKLMDGKFAYDKYTEHFAKYASTIYKTELIKVPEDLYMETLTTLDLYTDQFTGKKVELTGFVYREDGMSDRQFVIGRFAIQCCSADAAPYGVLVEYDRAKTFANDTWLKITGTVKKSKYNGNDLLTIEATKLQKIDPPKNEYVYPNFEFGS